MTMKLMHNQKGATHIIAALVIVLVAVVGFAGYRVMDANKDKDGTTTTSSQVPDKIQSKNDIEQASTALDSEDSDTTLDPSQLDSDLNDLL